MNYLLVRIGSTWTATGPSSNVILSSHKTLVAAQKAFNKVNGPVHLKASNGVLLDAKTA